MRGTCGGGEVQFYTFMCEDAYVCGEGISVCV